MYLIEVIPIIRLPANAPQILSYYFENDLKVGCVLEIPLNKRSVNAVVISSSPLINSKILLKKSDYQIKKASRLISEEPLVSEYQLKIASWLAKYYYSPLGSSLATVLPPFFGLKKYQNPVSAKKYLSNTEPKSERIRKLFTGRAFDIIPKLMPLISEQLRAKTQILILVPDVNIANHYNLTLRALGLEPTLISGKQSNSKSFQIWNAVAAGEIELVIGTRTSLFLPFKNLQLIIIEDSSNDMYKSEMVPKYRATDVAYELARLNNADVFMANCSLDISSYFDSINSRLLVVEDKKTKHNTCRLIDMKSERMRDNFAIFSSELKSEIVSAISNNGKVLIYTPRRGYASLYICFNCSQYINCPKCDIAMRVHKNNQFALICHHCGQTKEIPKFCHNCRSGNMRPAGYPGSQKIYDELRRYIEFGQLCKVPILILDSDVVKNETEVAEIIHEVSKDGPIILIATTMILSHRYDLRFDLVGITSIDALNNFSDFRTEEKLLITLEKLLDFRPGACLLQTSKIDDRINFVIKETNKTVFYESELKDRKLLFYPPFSRIIKLSFRAIDRSKSLIALRLLSEKLKMAIVQHKLEDRVVFKDNYSEYVYRENNSFVSILILKCDKDYSDIRNVLRYVPNGWSIDIEPNEIV